MSFSGRGAAVPSLASSQTGSHRSGRSSPSKELSKLELESDGIETKALSTGRNEMPRGLRDLVLDMEAIGHGVGIIPLSLKERIRDSQAVNASFLRFVFDEEADPSDDADVLKSNDIMDKAVCDVVSESIDCQEQQQVEMGWNNLVHTPLLKAALSGRDSLCTLRVTPCMTAKIIREYLPVYRPGKIVDYTISINPGHGNTKHPDSIAIDSLRKDLPLGTVNHTDFEALRRRPVAISIETKRRGEQQVRAEAQISVWLAAQWKFLARLVGDRDRHSRLHPWLHRHWRRVEVYRQHLRGREDNNVAGFDRRLDNFYLGRVPGHGGNSPLGAVGYGNVLALVPKGSAEAALMRP